MPPSLREWLPEDHLAWFVIDAVEEMDLGAFYGAYRADGHGRAAHDPAMMVALLLYAYARGSAPRGGSSAVRGGRRLPGDRANQRPITRRSRGFASATRRARRAVRRGAGAVRRGGAGEGRRDRGRRHEGPRERVAARDPRLRADRARDPRGGRGVDRARTSASARRAATSCPRSSRRRRAGAGGCARPSAALDERRASEARPIPQSRPERLEEAKRRLEEEHRVECHANAAYEAYRAPGVMKDGRRSVARRRRTSRPERRRARSTSPIRTRATSRRRAAGCRATTPSGRRRATRS